MELSDGTFERIAGLMYDTCRLSFPIHKKPLMLSRLGPRIQRLGLEGFDAYFERIRGGDASEEFQMAIDLLTTNETYFFREPEHFSVLESAVPKFDQRPLRCWSAASSFGDEAYSMAMTLADLERSGRVVAGWQVLATDISDRVLRSAREGIFPELRLRHVTDERRRRYCLRGDGDFEGLVQIRSELRDRLRFGYLNLAQPYEALGPFDVILLRNVLIYFDSPTRTAVVNRVLQELKPGGLFFLGTAEGRVPCDYKLETLRPGAFRLSSPGGLPVHPTRR